MLLSPSCSQEFYENMDNSIYERVNYSLSSDDNTMVESEHSENTFSPERNHDLEEYLTYRNLLNRQTLKKPERLEKSVDITKRRENLAMIGITEDLSIDEALRDPEWKKIITEELETLSRMNTWALIVAPNGIKPITCRWVLKQKDNGKCEARLVARGFEKKRTLTTTTLSAP